MIGAAEGDISDSDAVKPTRKSEELEEAVEHGDKAKQFGEAAAFEEQQKKKKKKKTMERELPLLFTFGGKFFLGGGSVKMGTG